MIDPYAVTNGERSQDELEEFWLFCPAVAGKKAVVIAKAIDTFLGGEGRTLSPFNVVRGMAAEGSLEEHLRRARLGKYRLLSACYRQSVDDDLDLRNAPVTHFEALPGVGPKTARFFILHTRPAARYAVIDTHVLKYLRQKGHDVPGATPQNPKRYAELEELVLAEADRWKMNPAAFDLAIWKAYSSGRSFLELEQTIELSKTSLGG